VSPVRPLPALFARPGWPRRLLAFAAGAGSAASLPPVDVAAVLFLTLPILVLLLDGAAREASVRRRLVAAGWIGWWFGFGYFLAGLWWIGSAFLVDAGAFGWMIPFAVTGLPAGLALFTALATVLATLLWTPGPARVAALAVGIAIAEWLRGHILTGFPWNGFGYALATNEATMQGAALVGAYGLAFLAILIFAAPGMLVCEGRFTGRRGAAAFGAATMALAALYGFGSMRLADAGAAPPAEPATPLRIVQPSIDQTEKWDPDQRTRVFETYLSLSEEPPAGGGALPESLVVIWPESAIPFFLSDAPVAAEAIGDILPPGGRLLTGAVRYQPRARAGEADYFNSILEVVPDGTVRPRYDKAHLVPFGEYLPFQDFLERIGLRQLTELPGGFSAGHERVTLHLDGVPPVGPLICYEIIFPGAAIDPSDRPAWLLNVTNDAWFGRTPGPYQHLLQARVRAVEEGLPVVRAANTGISALIDPHGRVLDRLGLGETGVIDADLPAAIAPPPYARFGDGPLFAILALSALGLVFARRSCARRAGD
jgi:apolipoprotein N-acyltransferase